jgi:TolA-binding protein
MPSKHLAIIVVLGTVLASCHKRPLAAVAPLPPTTVTVVVPVAVPAPVSIDIRSSLPAPAGASLFEQAELAYAMGDYVAAIQGYENYMQLVPNGDRIDHILFHLGIAYGLRTQPSADWTRATASLKQLVNEHPESPLKPTASLILSLRSDADQLASDAKARNQIVQQLRMQLERLKKIDADRLKRP